MDIIAAVTEDWGIGYKGNLLISIPDDMKFFRETTANSVVIMGRCTLESFPGKKPLKNRVNIVLSTDKSLAIDNATCLSDISQLSNELKKYEGKKVFVIGGEAIYKQLLPYCCNAYITKIQTVLPADKFFPNLDAEPDWFLTSQGEILEHDGIRYSFTTYKNQNILTI